MPNNFDPSKYKINPVSFDPNKYKQIDQQMFGPNAFDFSNVKKTVQMQAQAQALQKQFMNLYQQRLHPPKPKAPKVEKKTYQDAVDYIRNNKDQFLKPDGPSGAYQIANEIRNDPQKQAEIKAQGYNVTDYINALYAGLSDGKYRSEREYNQGVSSMTKDITARDKAYKDKHGMTQDQAYELQKKAKVNRPNHDSSSGVLDNIGGLFKDIGHDVSQKAKGAGNELSNIWKAISDGPGGYKLSDVAKDTQKTMKKQQKQDAQRGFSSNLSQEVHRGANRAMDAASLGALSDYRNRANQDGYNRNTNFASDRPVGKGGVTDFVTSGLGLLAPGSLAYKGAKALKVGDKTINGLTKLGASPTIAKLGGLGTEGAVAGGLFGAEQNFADPNMTFKQGLQNIGLNTALGAVADPILHVAGSRIAKFFGKDKVAKSELDSALNDPNTPNEVKQEILALPEPKMINTPVNDTTVMKTPMQYVGNIKNPIALRAERNPNAINEFRNKLNPNQEVAATKQFENISPQKAPTMARVQEPVQTNFSSQEEAFNSFRNKVDRTPKKRKDVSLYQKLHTNLVDDLSPLLKLEKNLNSGKVNNAENSLYKTARLFRGNPEKANHIVDNELLPIIKNVEGKGYSYKDLGDYALAMHAKDVNAKGINSGFSNQEIQSTINQLQSPVLEDARQQLLQLSNRLLSGMQKAGVISKESVDAMRNKWPNYMPLFRSFEDDKVDFHSGLGKALSNASSPIQTLKGVGEKELKTIDPLENMIKNIYQATNVIDRNGIGKQLANLAGKDTKQQYIRKLAPDEDTGRKNVISVMENGQKVKYEVPPDVYKTMMNLDKESTNLLINVLRKPASVLRAGATLTPEFSLRNPMRDINQAFAVSQSGFNPIVDFPVGLWQSIFKGKTIKIGGKEFKTSGKLYDQFIRDNGGFGNIVSMDRQMHRKALEKVIKEGNTNKFVNIINPKSYINLLRTIADVSETATKLGEYRAALRSGASRQEAAYRARDIMDFGRAGASIREANKVVAFLNANIQGKSKLIRAIKENPMKVLTKMAVTSTLPSVGAFVAAKYLASDQQKQVIDDAPKWLKDSFWLVPIPFTNQVARIPKPFDIAPIFSNLPEKAMEYAYNNDKHAFDGFAKELLSSYSIPVMLTGITPIIEGMANYSFFRQGPIIPQRENNVSYPDQYDINTPELSKAIAKGVNKLTGGEGMFKNFGSPRVIDNTISGFTGGMGNYANNFIDWMLSSTGAVDKGEKPAKQINQQPLLRSFLVNQSSTGESVNKLYDLRDKLTRQKGSAKEHGVLFKDAPKYQLVNSATSKIGKISSQMRTIQNNQSLSGQQKRTELDKLNALRNKIAIDTMKTLNR